MNPKINDGEYVFVSAHETDRIDRKSTICEFKEKEVISSELVKKQYKLQCNFR